jgi:hypothetical protein
MNFGSTQCCFVDHAVLEAFGEDCTKRAGDLAMEILKAYHEKLSTDAEGEEKARTKPVAQNQPKRLPIQPKTVSPKPRTGLSLKNRPLTPPTGQLSQNLVTKEEREEGKGNREKEREKKPKP